MVSGSQGNTCFEITQPPHPPAQPPACVINLNPPSTPSGPVYSEAQIQDFFNGLPADQTVIMVYRGEPEGKTDFSGCTGSTDAAKFVSCFEQESSNIRAAAAYWGRTENVFTADDSGSYEYDTPDSDSTDKTAGMSPAPCGWIAPPSYTDFYLLDHYEHGWADGSPLSAQNGDTTHDGQQQWNNWLGCVNGSGKPIGLAEYGLCSGGKFCGPQKTCGTSASTQLDHDTMEADRLYLEGEPSGRSPTLLWEYWYDNCWKFDNSNNMQTEWKDIENQNGGAVGG
jgi:hypothetical protein